MPLGSAPRAGLSAAGSRVGVGPSPWVSRVFPDFPKMAFTISTWKQPTVCLSAKTKGSRMEERVWVPSGCGRGPHPGPAWAAAGEGRGVPGQLGQVGCGHPAWQHAQGA